MDLSNLKVAVTWFHRRLRGEFVAALRLGYLLSFAQTPTPR
jgi:hypothetical protein